MSDLPSAALWRRLLAMLYDAILLLGILMAATALVLPLTGGEAINDALRWPYRVYLLMIGCGFFAVFWRFGGQTLGMRAWRLQVRAAGGPLSWRQAWLRAFASLLSLAPLGLGFAWSVIDPQRRTWHDRLSATRLVVIPRRRKS